MSIFNDLVERVGSDPASWVLVVGSGLSKHGVRPHGKGLPDWNELIRLMVADLAQHGSHCPPATVTQLRTQLRETPPPYLDIADAFHNAYDHDIRGYEEFLHRHLRPNDLVESELHKFILAVGFRGILSYNFDLVFEKQSDKVRSEKIVYPDILDRVHCFQQSGYFAKVHGCIDRPVTQLVLTGSSFRDLSANRQYTELLKAVFLGNRVLCVGFSLNDPDFQSILANLKDCWNNRLPPLVALMKKGEQVATDWLSKGVDILPYADHGEVKTFFQQLAARCGTGGSRSRRAGKVASRRSGRRTSPPLSATPASLDAEARELQEFIKEWQGEQKIAEMDAMMSQHLSGLSSAVEREAWVFRVAAMCRSRDRAHLCHHLIALGSPACLDLARQILRGVAQEDEFRVLSPDHIHLAVHQFVLTDPEWQIEHDGVENQLKWLLDAEWGKHGVDLTVTFRRLLSRVLSSPRERKLDLLYITTEHIPGAAAEIEKIALATGFPPRNDRVESSWDKHVIEKIKKEKLRRLLFPHPRKLSPAAMLNEAKALEGPEDEYCPCIRLAARFLLTDFVHHAHLGLQHSSSLYDPAKAREIVDALASLRSPQQQITVLWAINRWGEDHHGLGSLQVDSESLREGLLVPLWWRYSSETRMRYLAESNRHRGMHPVPQWTGQEFLLCDLMGLRYDVDEDFRREFNKSLDHYGPRPDEERYVPFHLQALWRERELGYDTVETAPPELARRIVTRWADPKRSQDADKQWEEVEAEALTSLGSIDGFRKVVSAERQDYVIDNLLGAYFPAKRRVVLYRRTLRLAASDLGIDCDALSTVVYIHETVHAFAHLGRDLSDRMWDGCVVPEVQVPEFQAARAVEGIAQFYTFKLLERVGDKRLLDAFCKLEEHSHPLYREWRKTEHYSLEAMRAVLMRLRDAETEWPPSKP
jgi:hypothetical protein